MPRYKVTRAAATVPSAGAERAEDAGDLPATAAVLRGRIRPPL